MNKVFLLCEGASLSALLHTCKLATESAGFTCWESVWCVKWAPYWDWVLPCTTDPKTGFAVSLVATELYSEVRVRLGISTVLSRFSTWWPSRSQRWTIIDTDAESCYAFCRGSFKSTWWCLGLDGTYGVHEESCLSLRLLSCPVQIYTWRG